MSSNYIVVRVEEGEPVFFSFDIMPLRQAEEIADLMGRAFHRQYGVINLNTFLSSMEGGYN